MKSYLSGQWSGGGWWYYYFFAWAIKLPLGTWALVLLGIGVTFGAKGYSASWRDELALLLPMAAILLLLSSQTGFSIHSRYSIPALPFLFIWVGKAARAFRFGHRVIATVAGTGLLWSLSSSLSYYPHSLAYFNELVGGPLGGHNYLLDSNVSWGQDLFYLKRWLVGHPEATPFHLAYFGQVDPRLAGIDFTLPDEEAGPVPGWYGIDVNYLHGSSLPAADGNGNWQCFGTSAFRYFLDFKPVATAGYSIFIYHVTPEDANRARRRMGLSELATKGHSPSPRNARVTNKLPWKLSLKTAERAR